MAPVHSRPQGPPTAEAFTFTAPNKRARTFSPVGSQHSQTMPKRGRGRPTFIDLAVGDRSQSRIGSLLPPQATLSQTGVQSTMPPPSQGMLLDTPMDFEETIVDTQLPNELW